MGFLDKTIIRPWVFKDSWVSREQQEQGVPVIIIFQKGTPYRDVIDSYLAQKLHVARISKMENVSYDQMLEGRDRAKKEIAIFIGALDKKDKHLSLSEVEEAIMQEITSFIPDIIRKEKLYRGAFQNREDDPEKFIRNRDREEAWQDNEEEPAWIPPSEVEITRERYMEGRVNQESKIAFLYELQRHLLGKAIS